jgi:hypothetical protein
VAAALLAATKSSAAIAGYILLSALIALGAAALLRDRSFLDHRVDYDQQTRALDLRALPAPAPARYVKGSSNGRAPAAGDRDPARRGG